MARRTGGYRFGKDIFPRGPIEVIFPHNDIESGISESPLFAVAGLRIAEAAWKPMQSGEDDQFNRSIFAGEICAAINYTEILAAFALIADKSRANSIGEVRQRLVTQAPWLLGAEILERRALSV